MKIRKKIRPWIYCTPAFILILGIIIFPIGYTFYISLTNMNLFHWFDFKMIGLDNYKKALFTIDSGFLKAIVMTVVWTAVNMIAQMAVAYFIALGLNVKGLKLARFYKTLLMFPWAMPAYVSVLLWKVGMYNTEFGFLNQLLVSLGFHKVEFLSTDMAAFLSCTALNLWMALPFMIMMIDGALQSIDQSCYESAQMDGAGFIKKNFYVTIPMLKPIIAPAVIMTTFTTFKQFDIVYLLTMQKGSLSGSRFQTILTYAHENAFISNNYGLSSAVSIIIFVLIIVISLGTNRSLKEEQ